MRIGIEANTWSNRRGYGRFLRELVTNLVEEFPQHEFVLVVDHHTARESRFPERATIEVVRTKTQQTQAASADGSRGLRDLWRMGWTASRLPVDVFIFPNRYTFYPLFSRVKTVITFHDATSERHPQLIFPSFKSRLFWRIKTWLALRQADRLVTVSEDARRQIADVFGLAESEITVISEGADPVFRPHNGEADLTELRARYALPAEPPLILYVGGISPHKNLDGLLRAMAQVEGPWHLALVGEYEKDSFFNCHQELMELAAELGLTRRVTFAGFVPDEDLVELYNGATLLVLPSMSEGFGLPVIEAMACGLPVAASDRNSIPEVLGSAGLLFDPLSPEQMAQAIGRLLTDGALRAELRQKGLDRAKQFSWKTAAHKMMAILDEVVDAP